MTIMRSSKLTIVGAGSVGTSLANAALIRGSAREVVLYDIATARVEAEVLDLAHGTPFVGSSRITGGSDIGLVADSDVVVITAGASSSRARPGWSWRASMWASWRKCCRNSWPRPRTPSSSW